MNTERISLIAVRVVLPVALVIAGTIAIIVGHGRTSAAGAGVVLLGVAVMVILINWMFRLGVDSGKDREREEAAREYYDRTGQWPDDGAG